MTFLGMNPNSSSFRRVGAAKGRGAPHRVQDSSLNLAGRLVREGRARLPFRRLKTVALAILVVTFVWLIVAGLVSLGAEAIVQTMEQHEFRASVFTPLDG